MTQSVDSTPGAALAAKLTLTLLGPLRIAREGLPLSFGYEKVQALLVYLAVEARRTHRRSALAELLWPDQDEHAARHNLSQALFNLRRTVHDDPDNSLLLTTRDSVRLNPASALWLDVAAFRALTSDADSGMLQLERAMALYSGDFLEGFSIGDSVGFEEWALLIREQLRVQAGDLLRRLTESHDDLDDPARVLEYARRWVAFEPLSEEAHRRVMHALAHSGQRSAALAQFEYCRQLLHDELGIEPEPATIVLYEELKRSGVSPLPRPRPMRDALSLPPTRLIDRERELAELAALLGDPTNRLITISGTGGVGKTRLALHTAAANAQSFANGVCFVPLAPVHEPVLVPSAIAQALGLAQNQNRPPDELVRAALAPQHLLLLLDNCEHLLPTLATLVAQLLAAAPQLVVLTTSRVALRLSQECPYQLAPLSLPEAEQTAEMRLAQSGAVALFIERAQAVRPTVELDLAAIGAICRRLDGLPLAIELAATHTRLLRPYELLARLDQRLPLLSGGPRDLPERQQTLHATIDWSYQLLTPAQQALFCRLAVFAGGWTVVAAETICADQPGTATVAGMSILDGLTALLDASLITPTSSRTDEPYCRMLETIREYALEQLAAREERERTHIRLASWIVERADQAKTALTSANAACWTAHIINAHGDVQTALRWTMDRGEIEAALRIGRGLWRFWWRSGFAREGLEWLRLALGRDRTVDTQIRAEALHGAGVLAWSIGDYAQAHHWLAQGLELARTLPDRHSEAAIYIMLGILTRGEGAFVQAHAYFEQSRMLSATLSDQHATRFAIMGLAEIDTRLGQLDDAAARYLECITLNGAAGDTEGVAASKRRLAYVYCLQQCNYAEAEMLCAESLELCHAVDDQQGLSQTLFVLGNLAQLQGDYARATVQYQESLLLRKKLERHEDCAQTLEALAVSLGQTECEERAVQFMGAAFQLRVVARSPLTAFEQATLEPAVAAWRTRLGEADFDELWRCGQLLTLEQVTQLALSVACYNSAVVALL